MSHFVTYDAENLGSFCDLLVEKDPDFKKIIDDHGYPRAFSREQGFPGLIRLILEQQVSLLSAKAAYIKLLDKVKEVTPQNMLNLTAEELRQCYFSRQKAAYARALAEAVVNKKLNLTGWEFQPDDEVRSQLIQIKGIGLWTADNYLLLCLHRLDIFPVGDIALLNSIKKIKRLSVDSTREEILELAEPWRPYRSIATLLFWHAYIIDRKINIEELRY